MANIFRYVYQDNKNITQNGFKKQMKPQISITVSAHILFTLETRDSYKDLMLLLLVFH